MRTATCSDMCSHACGKCDYWGRAKGMGRLSLAAIATATLLLGCSTNKTLVPTGGSRSDGTIELSYEISSLQKANLDSAQGLEAARSRCRAWGYSDAEPFGGEKRACQQQSSYGCAQWFVTVTYQCLGGNRPS